MEPKKTFKHYHMIKHYHLFESHHNDFHKASLSAVPSLSACNDLLQITYQCITKVPSTTVQATSLTAEHKHCFSSLFLLHFLRMCCGRHRAETKCRLTLCQHIEQT